MYLLRRVEKYLQHSGTPPSSFGRYVLGDPRFVFDLRGGREPRAETVARVNAWLDRLEARCG